MPKSSSNSPNKDESFIEILECSICGESQNIEERFSLHYFNDEVLKLNAIDNIPDIKLLRCRICDHYYASYMINPSVLNNYYSKISSVIYQTCSIQSVDSHEKERIKQAQEIEKYCPNGGKILDVGCGNGFLLSHLKSGNWDTFGVEPSITVSEIAKNNGVKILAQYIDQISASLHSFDVILLFDVMEHLAQPRQMIQNVYRLLKSGGIIIILTGNINSLNSKLTSSMWSYFNTYEHISFFSLSSIKYLLATSQFKNIRINKVSCEIGLVKNSFSLFKNLVRFILFKLRIRKLPISPLAFDHMLVFAQK
jgi:2-polyprenyl-3-methyl-5-hydroxy-6-metoxy-1,4-benzoquinol methylase